MKLIKFKIEGIAVDFIEDLYSLTNESGIWNKVGEEVIAEMIIILNDNLRNHEMLRDDNVIV